MLNYFSGETVNVGDTVVYYTLRGSALRGSVVKLNRVSVVLRCNFADGSVRRVVAKSIKQVTKI